MLSETQYLEKTENVKKVVIEFLMNKRSIKQISEELGISTSSVQRYLNDKVYIENIFKNDASFIIEEIHQIIKIVLRIILI